MLLPLLIVPPSEGRLVTWYSLPWAMPASNAEASTANRGMRVFMVASFGRLALCDSASAQRHLRDPRTELLAQPSDAADPAEIGGGEHGAAVSNRVDIMPRRASDRQHLIDREVGKRASVAFVAGQAFKMHRRLERIILKHRGGGIMRAGVDTKDELGHAGGVCGAAVGI